MSLLGNRIRKMKVVEEFGSNIYTMMSGQRGTPTINYRFAGLVVPLDGKIIGVSTSMLEAGSAGSNTFHLAVNAGSNEIAGLADIAGSAGVGSASVKIGDSGFETGIDVEAGDVVHVMMLTIASAGSPLEPRMTVTFATM